MKVIQPMLQLSVCFAFDHINYNLLSKHGCECPVSEIHTVKNSSLILNHARHISNWTWISRKIFMGCNRLWLPSSD